MNTNTRLILNTIAQSVRTVINIVLSLYSTRLATEALGVSDYGIYMLVAGIASLLYYFSRAMVVTTQRHLSYSYGRSDMLGARTVFSNSNMLHWAVGLALVLLSACFISLIFDCGFLNIDAAKIGEAKWVYVMALLSVLLTVTSSPFRALLTAHENIVYISIVDVLDGVLKFGLVFVLFFIDENRLAVYSTTLVAVMLFDYFALAIYAVLKYEECCFFPTLRLLNMRVIRSLMGFTSWTLYGMGAVFVRNQGVAVLLNRTFGTIYNASYGYATQVFGAVQFFSQAVQNALSPQIVKAEGSGNRERMISLSEMASKYCFLLLAVVAVPIIFEMPLLLELWLGNVPAYAVYFSQALLVAALIDQLTIGLNIANQAIGRIRNYTLLVYTIKATTVPAVWLGLKMGIDLYVVFSFYVILEFVAAVVRLPYMRRNIGLDVAAYLRRVWLRVLGPALAMSVVCALVIHEISDLYGFRFLLTGILNVLTCALACWLFAFTRAEKDYVLQLVSRITK